LGCGINWWTAELPILDFSSAAECTSYITAKNIADQVDGCYPDTIAGQDVFRITGLTDLMGSTSTTTNSGSDGDPIARTTEYPRYTDSFQRACERRVLNVLADPGLTP
jgi:hypothetical protein